MRGIVTVTQRFPTWAAAYEARERLLQDHDLDDYGIERVDIERLGGRFELLVRTDEFHRDQIEHALRSSDGRLSAPATRPRRSGSPVVPLLMAGAATVAAIGLLSALWPRREGQVRGSQTSTPRTEAPTGTPMFTLEVDGAPVAVTKGNRGEARAIFEGAEFKDKLRRMESDGRPLWNGGGSFNIRPASRAEIRAFVQYAETLGFEDDEEGEIILYLRPIDSPDEFDETQDG
jgi:uncharacterized protein YjiS (DUF1127 family)